MSFIKCFNLVKNVKTVCCNALTKGMHTWHTNTLTVLPQLQQHALMGSTIGAQMHTSVPRQNLTQFFDDPKNWTENEVKVGRAWKLDELRIKSNKELHQLWYVLLKERNMLMTMEHECNDKMEFFPSPERLDKVKISMNNLETVVRERNKAYHLLETGETGERPQRLVKNALGLNLTYRSCEHVLPPYMNVKWIKSRYIGCGGRAVHKFLLKYREKLYNVKRKSKNRSRNEVMMLLRRNPNLDLNILKRKYPEVDIDKLLSADKIRGHFVPKVGA